MLSRIIVDTINKALFFCLDCAYPKFKCDLLNWISVPCHQSGQIPQTMEKPIMKQIKLFNSEPNPQHLHYPLFLNMEKQARSSATS